MCSVISVVQKFGHLVIEGSFHELGVVRPGLGEVWQGNETIPVSLQFLELSVEEAIRQSVEQFAQLSEIEIKPSEVGSSDPLALAHNLNNFCQDRPALIDSSLCISCCVARDCCLHLQSMNLVLKHDDPGEFSCA